MVFFTIPLMAESWVGTFQTALRKLPVLPLLSGNSFLIDGWDLSTPNLFRELESPCFFPSDLKFGCSFLCLSTACEQLDPSCSCSPIRGLESVYSALGIFVFTAVLQMSLNVSYLCQHKGYPLFSVLFVDEAGAPGLSLLGVL